MVGAVLVVPGDRRARQARRHPLEVDQRAHTAPRAPPPRTTARASSPSSSSRVSMSVGSPRSPHLDLADARVRRRSRKPDVAAQLPDAREQRGAEQHGMARPPVVGRAHGVASAGRGEHRAHAPAASCPGWSPSDDEHARRRRRAPRARAQRRRLALAPIRRTRPLGAGGRRRARISLGRVRRARRRRGDSPPPRPARARAAGGRRAGRAAWAAEAPPLARGEHEPADAQHADLVDAAAARARAGRRCARAASPRSRP